MFYISSSVTSKSGPTGIFPLLQVKTDRAATTISATRTLRSLAYQPASNEVLAVNVELKDSPLASSIPPEIEAFWRAFTWVNNPLIPDGNALVLTRRKYARIQVTAIDYLEITRMTRKRYPARVPTAPGYSVGHTVAKLQRWLIAIILS